MTVCEFSVPFIFKEFSFPTRKPTQNKKRNVRNVLQTMINDSGFYSERVENLFIKQYFICLI